jgi:hypothetical protein
MNRRRAIVPMYSDEHLVIDSICLESLPCHHVVIYDGKAMQLGGQAIVDYFHYNKKPVPLHFRYLLTRADKRTR